ncbi:hypothetical protein DM02DRAFT_632803 [Periconia macrospinosa]|uniref:Uncharacterized protein n=1 Tax=Periconia macrospinosa TaxID=97972 RepID=A0A2V1DED0_9PLEO|nr:hypothetical protein DM02DRAFT_632803 [Periconia macrospinosa]
MTNQNVYRHNGHAAASTTGQTTPKRPTVSPITPRRSTVSPITPRRPTVSPITPRRPTVSPITPRRPTVSPITPRRPTVSPITPRRPTVSPPINRDAMWTALLEVANQEIRDVVKNYKLSLSDHADTSNSVPNKASPVNTKTSNSVPTTPNRLTVYVITLKRPTVSLITPNYTSTSNGFATYTPSIPYSPSPTPTSAALLDTRSMFAYKTFVCIVAEEERAEEHEKNDPDYEFGGCLISIFHRPF